MGKTTDILKSGLLLSAVAILMRTVGVGFNAYLKGQLGESGMGLVSLTMSVYGFAVTFATSGIALSVTRLVAEALGRKDRNEAAGVMRAAVKYALFFGLLAGTVLFFGSDGIATGLLGDLRTRPSLRLLAFSLPPIALSSVFSGYFVAVRRVRHNAITQLFEQAVRIVLTVTLLSAFLPKGLEYACLAIVGGSSLAELFSFFLLLIQYLHDRKRALPFRKARGKGLLKEVSAVALPTATAAWCRSGLLTAEHLLIPVCLAMGAFSRDEALASYATIHGMAIPLVLWPAAILTSFAGLLVPEVAESRSAEQYGHITRAMKKAITGALLFSAAAAAVIASSADALGMLIYRSEEVGRYLKLLAPLIPVMYLDSVVDAFLKGLGKQVYCMGVNIADAALAVLLVRLLLPRMGAIGYLPVIYITEIFNFLLSAGRLFALVKPPAEIGKSLLLCPLAALGIYLLQRRIFPPPDGLPALLATSLFVISGYLSVLLLSEAIDKKRRKPGLGG